MRRLSDPQEHAGMRGNILEDMPRIRSAHSKAKYVAKLTRLYADVLGLEAT